MFKCIECEYYSQRSYNVQRHNTFSNVMNIDLAHSKNDM